MSARRAVRTDMDTSGSILERTMRNRRDDRRTGSQKGFSLVEVLVAMTITLIVSGAIYGLLSGGQNAFRREPELTERQQNARNAMNLIMRDIANAGAGMPTFVQTFTPGLNAFSGAPSNASNVVTDELEMLTNSGSMENEPVCYTSGSGNGANIRFVRNATQIPTPLVVVLLMDDGTWTIRNIISVSNSNGGPGNCTAGDPHAVPNLNQGAGDTTGLNTPSGVCVGNGWGTNTNANCNVSGVSFATIVRYRIRNGADGVPNLERFSSDDTSAFTGAAVNASGFKTIARGIEDLQVQYTQASAPTTWVDGAPTVTNGNYTSFINQVRVSIVARSEARNIQGARTSASGRTNIRGTLSSVGAPRATLFNMANAPSPSPRPWF